MDGVAILYNADGSIKWVAGIGTDSEEGYANFSKAIEVSDGFILSGNFNNSITTSKGTLTPSGGYDSLIVKYNKNGQLVWQNSYGGGDLEDSKNSGLQILNNGNILLGISSSSSSITTPGLENVSLNQSGIVLLEVDKDTGSYLNQSVIDYADYDYLNDIVVLPNDKLVLAISSGSSFGGKTLIGYYDTYIMQLDETRSNIEWINNIGVANGYTNATKLIRTTSGDYVISGYSQDGGIMDLSNANNNYNDGYIAKFSSTGSLVWYKLFSGDSFDSLVSVIEDRNGNYLATGYSRSSSIEGLSGGGGDNIPLLTYSSEDGNILSKQFVIRDSTDETDAYSRAYTIVPIDVADGHFLLSVSTFSDWKNPDYTCKGNNDMVLLEIGESKFNIELETTENGTLAINKDAYLSGNEVTIEVNPNTSYQLKHITVKNLITNEEEEVIDNTFIMPAANVSISAEFEIPPVNPSTGDGITFSLLLGIISLTGIVGCALFSDRKKELLNK